MIFTNERLLDPDYVPRDRLVDREEQFANIEYAVTPMIFGRDPEDVLLTGPRGTGKTTCARFAARKEVQNAIEQGIVATSAYADCRTVDTDVRATRSIARTVNQPAETGVTIPDSGLSREAYHDRLWQILDDQYDAALVVLDHVDRLDSAGLLETLVADDHACTVAVIGIVDGPADELQLPDSFQHAVADQTYAFEPYDREQLAAILESRQAAFRAGVLAEGTIDAAADRAVRSSGGARTAMTLLREAGHVARQRGASRVTPDHVTAAADALPDVTLRESLVGLPRHARYVLAALAHLTARHDADSFRTTRVYAAYEDVCAEQDESPRTVRRVQEFLATHAESGLTDRTVHRGGRAEGNYHEHRLRRDPADVLAALEGNDTVNTDGV